ncbi:MAG: hypothetical protein ACI9P3_005430 [Bradyrhizobium sp.]|jgi:hypothetical protein
MDRGSWTILQVIFAPSDGAALAGQRPDAKVTEVKPKT